MGAFFLVVRGDRLEVAAWKRTATAHAAALDLVADSAQWSLTNGAELLVSVLGHPARQQGQGRGLACRILEGRDGAGFFELHVNDARPQTATSVLFNPVTATVRLRTPFASPDQAYIWRSPTTSLVTNDLRLAVARQQFEIDPHGVYALLQYGAIPAPFTLFRGVERVLPGHEASLDSTILTRVPQSASPPDLSLSGDPETYVAALVDHVLLRERRPSAIFFSGGVDSGFLAARVAAAGFRDVPLLNYAFGADDPEAAHAQRMASRLGMPLERIEHSPQHTVRVLARAARDYSYPFADYSSLPMNLLVQASTAWLPSDSEVVDGTGADGAFALGFAVENTIRSRYTPVAMLPSWIGELAGHIHAFAGLTATDGLVASIARFIHSATTMPSLLAAVIAQNSLHGECFRVATEIRADVEGALMQMVAALAPSTSLADRATTLDVVHVCGGMYAAKDFDPARHRGIDVLYPFLHPNVLGPSLELPWSARCAGRETKALLKRALTRHLPPDLVYRRKSGFTPPLRNSFTDDLRDFVQGHTLRRDSSMAGFLRWRGVDRLFTRAFRGEPVHAAAYNLLWALTFLSAWIHGLAELRAEVHSKMHSGASR